MSKREYTVFAIFVCLLVLTLIFFRELITFSQAIDLMLTFALILITTIYVKRTADIAKATKEQANASIKMAEETRNARFAALKPIISRVLKNSCWGTSQAQFTSTF
jgi:uncharacterized membrane protein